MCAHAHKFLLSPRALNLRPPQHHFHLKFSPHYLHLENPTSNPTQPLHRYHRCYFPPQLPSKQNPNFQTLNGKKEIRVSQQNRSKIPQDSSLTNFNHNNTEKQNRNTKVTSTLQLKTHTHTHTQTHSNHHHQDACSVSRKKLKK